MLRKRGWRESIIPYTGYGNSEHVRVLGRLVLRPTKPRTPLGVYAADFINQRGWRNFISAPVPFRPVTVEMGDHRLHVISDRNGYIDVSIRSEGLDLGWQSVTLLTDESEPVTAPINVIRSDQQIGLISDIDDTIISTWLPRSLLAAYNSFILTEQNRQAIPGMARMYQQFLQRFPGAPIVYVSTGSWATLPFLRRFMRRHGFPVGPMLLTDFGPSQNAWFRNGSVHKRRALAELARDFPTIKWVLVGDDGQHDPLIYREFSQLRPDHVKAIALRQLSSAEQILAHGTSTVLRDNADLEWKPACAPEVFGQTGDDLGPALFTVLDEEG